MGVLKRIVVLLDWLFYWPLFLGCILIVSPFILLAWILTGNKVLGVIDYIYDSLGRIEDWANEY